MMSLWQLAPIVNEPNKNSHQNHNQNINYVDPYKEPLSSIVDLERSL